MPRSATVRSTKAGLPPGTLVHVGERKIEKARITVVDFDENQCSVKEADSVDECAVFRGKPTTTWINVNGIHQVELIEALGECFGLHPLLMEDILDTGQRPKMEDYGDHVFLVLKTLFFDEDEKEIVAEQVSLVLGSNFVISFQETEADVFDGMRERIKNGKGRLRKMGADYLAYGLIDCIVDNYFVLLEKLGEEIELLEEKLVADPRQETLQSIHELKREMLFVRKSVWPLREVISALHRGESSLIRESTQVYLRDLYDHTIQVIDTMETFRDMLSGMVDIYLSSVSHKLNEVMKVLTIIATIFIPLTFVAGVYGMNFKYMPELEWRWGYPVIMLVMSAAAVSMLIYFRRKNWL
jgi:magnesium transporter